MREIRLLAKPGMTIQKTSITYNATVSEVLTVVGDLMNDMLQLFAA